MRGDENLKLDMPFEEALQRFANVNIKDVSEPTSINSAQPFVKWVGGKRSIISALLESAPENFTDYYEPFVGGGALFFAIAQKAKHTYLSDANLDLIFAYTAIKKNPDELIELLKKHASKHCDEYYYKVRSQHELQNPIEIAARFIYLNRTCYNGLYRVNKAGEFNVPAGKYVNPNIIQEENIRACHKLLKETDIQYRQFETISPNKGDFVYFDPPYHPTVEASFTKYTKSDFTEKDQLRLRDFALSLHKKGVLVMLSNSDTEFIKDLYSQKPFKIKIVQAPRLVNCKAYKRNAVNEVLITNY